MKKKKDKQPAVASYDDDEEDEDDSSYKPSTVNDDDEDMTMVSALSLGGVSKVVDNMFMYSNPQAYSEPTCTPVRSNKNKEAGAVPSVSYNPVGCQPLYQRTPKSNDKPCTAGHYAGMHNTDVFMKDYIHFHPPVGVNPLVVKLPVLQDKWNDTKGNQRISLSFHLLSGMNSARAKGCITEDGNKFQLWSPMSDKIDSKTAITSVVRSEGEDLDKIHQAFLKEPRVIGCQITMNKLEKHKGPGGLWCMMEVKLIMTCHSVFASSLDGDDLFFGVRQIEFEDNETWIHFELISKKAPIKIPVRKAYPDNVWGTPTVAEEELDEDADQRLQAQKTIFMRPRPCSSVGPKATSSVSQQHMNASVAASREPFTTIHEEDSDEEEEDDASEDEYTYETVNDDNMDVDNESKASTQLGVAQTVISHQKSVATKYSVAGNAAAAMKAKLNEASASLPPPKKQKTTTTSPNAN